VAERVDFPPFGLGWLHPVFIGAASTAAGVNARFASLVALTVVFHALGSFAFAALSSKSREWGNRGPEKGRGIAIQAGLNGVGPSVFELWEVDVVAFNTLAVRIAKHLFGVALAVQLEAF
jgi:hypothetical protein